MLAGTKPRKQPKQARSKATVEAILTATTQVLTTEGFDRLTTGRIAEVAGVSVGSLYQYFPSKDALIYALVEQSLEELTAALEAAIQRTIGSPLPYRFEEIIRSLLQLKASRPRLSAELARHSARLERSEVVRRYAMNAETHIERLLADHEGEIRLHDRSLAAWVIVHSVTGMLDAACVAPPRALDDPALLAHFTRVVLAYLGAEGRRFPERP